MLRDFLTREMIALVARALGSDEPELRASLVGSQIIGLMMTRYIVGLEPLASLPAERVADLIAPTLQLSHPPADTQSIHQESLQGSCGMPGRQDRGRPG